MKTETLLWLLILAFCMVTYLVTQYKGTTNPRVLVIINFCTIASIIVAMDKGVDWICITLWATMMFSLLTQPLVDFFFSLHSRWSSNPTDT